MQRSMSPEAFNVPVCPTVRSPNSSMFNTAFQSLSCMCPHWEHLWVRWLNDFLTASPQLEQFWRFVVGWDSDCHHSEHFAEILQPTVEVRPCSIRNRLGQLAVFNHIPHLQVLIGNQVVRLDDAPCQLYGKVFTLPTYLEVFSTQAISSFNSVLRTFLSTRKLTIQTLKRFFRFSQVRGIINSLTIGLGIKMSQSNIPPNGSIGRLSLLNSFLVNAKLNVVPVSPTHNSNSFNLLQLIKVQVTGSPQLKDSCCKTIGEGDTFPVFRQLISCRFVLNRTLSLMFFEAWETFLSWFAFFTVVVESRNRRPRSFVP